MNQTIYLLHGWAISEHNEKKWEEFRAILKKNGVLTKYLAIPGLTTKLNEVWTLDTFVSWLDKQLPVNTPVILLGHSFGGQIICQFAAQNPERVSKIILIDSAGMIDRSLKKVIKRFSFKILAKVGKPIFKHEFFRKALYKLAREKDYLQANKYLQKTMDNVINTEIIDYLPQINSKTLIIWGENDVVTPIKFAREFKRLINDSDLRIIKNARHSPQFTHPDETAKEVEKFLK